MKVKNISLDEYASIFEESYVLSKQETAYFIIYNLLFEERRIVLINTASECFVVA